MTDGTKPAAPTRAPALPARAPKAPIAALAAAIAAAVAIALPHTAASEGERLRAYQDQAKVWTVCDGHTAGVYAGMTATHAQCIAWLKAELSAHTAAAAAATPALAEQLSALAMAGDFSFNAGDARWAASPMAAHFSRREWRAGCEAFRGYVVLYRAPKVMPGQACRRNTKGVLYCQAKGLVTRRETDRAVCLSGLPN